MVGNKRALDLAWSAERWMSRFSYWIPSADLWRWRPSAVTIYLGAQDMKSHRFCQTLAAPVLRPGSARNESSTAGSHSSGGWQCYRYSLIPNSCNTQFALCFFSKCRRARLSISVTSDWWRRRVTTLLTDADDDPQNSFTINWRWKTYLFGDTRRNPCQRRYFS